MVRALYRLLTHIAPPLLWGVLLWRGIRGKQEWRRLGEAAGYGRIARPNGRLVWIHAASVGEVASVLPLVDRIRAHAPDTHILLTTTTRTAALRVRQKQDADLAHFTHAPTHRPLIHQYAAFDAPLWVARFLRHWQPNIALRVESEIWANTIAACATRQIPLVLVNGRLSPRSFKRWRKFAGTLRQILAPFALLLAQDDTSADRFAILGIQTQMVGNLKLDAPPLPVSPVAVADLRRDLGARPFWLAASTHKDEEDTIIAAHKILAHAQPDILTLIAPRHPERGDQIAAMARRAGLHTAQRSKGDKITPATHIYIADTLGELGVLFHLAPIVLIGGTLAPHGGHNALEAIRLECAVLHGPYTDNFNELFTALDSAGAARCVRTATDIADAVRVLLSDTTTHAIMIKQGMICEAAMRGATARVMDLLIPLLEDAHA